MPEWWHSAIVLNMPTDEVTTTTVRLPTWLVDKIDELAKDQRRSRNAMITVLLERAVES